MKNFQYYCLLPLKYRFIQVLLFAIILFVFTINLVNAAQSTFSHSVMEGNTITYYDSNGSIIQVIEGSDFKIQALTSHNEKNDLKTGSTDFFLTGEKPLNTQVAPNKHHNLTD